MKVRPIIEKISKSLQKSPHKWKFEGSFIIPKLINKINSDCSISLETVLSDRVIIYINSSRLETNQEESLIINDLFKKIAIPLNKKYTDNLTKEFSKDLNKNIKIALKCLN
jgi:hypothetical protein